jgi:putative transcriptional regulator
MSDGAGPEEDAGVLRSKRNATRYQILVGIAERQPAVSQQEIADAIGITAQAVSDYLGDLVAEGYVEKHGRGRYEVTNEGVDWLISRTEDLRTFVEHVSEEVIGEVEIVGALATDDIEEGQTVSLSMRDGIERATPGDHGGTTATAVTDAAAGEEVGVTDFQGVLDYELGAVTVLSVPPVQDGGSRTVDAAALAERAADHDLLAVAGTEAIAAAHVADLEPDLRFGTAGAVEEAAMTGLDVLVVATASRLSAHIDRLREKNLSYEVLEATDG